MRGYRSGDESARARLGWQSAGLDLEVARARSGKPEIVLQDKSAQFAAALDIRRRGAVRFGK